MKKLYFLLFTLILTGISFGQTTVFQESFETGNSGTPSETCNDGVGDFFTRTDGSDIGTFYQVSGQDGNFFFAAMDTDGAPCTLTTQTLEFDDIDISTFTDLTLAILLAEDKDGSNFDWDEDSRFYIEVDVDNSGTFTKVLQVSVSDNTGGSNVSQPMIDSDFDGNGDGAEITDVFTEYSASISSGSLLDIRLVFENLLAGDEDMAIDNIRIVDGFTSSPVISVSSDISGLDYEFDNGPSNEASFTVEGVDLNEDITVTPPANFEISTDSGSGFGTAPIVLTETGGIVTTQTLYVRLADGLAIGDYNGNIEVTSSGATDRLINVEGSVFEGLTNALLIAGVYDALNNSAPKGVELYVTSDIADLSKFGLGSANNGGGTDGEEYTFPAVSVTAGDRIFVASETVEFTNFFGSAPDYTDSAMGINGDDAIELFENGQVIDVFGDINVDGTGQTWDYVDGWAYRVNNTGPDGSTFDINNWTFSGTGNLDGVDNDSSTVPYPLNQYTLSVISNTNTDFRVFPNPNTTGTIMIVGTSEFNFNITIFDILGQRVLSQEIESGDAINISRLNAGLYLININQGNTSITKKLVVK